jgi:hypothetical protein
MIQTMPGQGVKQRTKPIADREEILLLLSDAARKGHVGAMRLLLEEQRRDGEAPAASNVIDEIAAKRTKTAAVG